SGIETAVGERRITLDTLAAGGDQVAVLVDLECAVAGVVEGAVVARDEEPRAAQGEVEVVGGGSDVALAELLSDLGHLYAVADRGPRDALLGLREQVGKLRARFLETGRIDVREIVRGDVEIGIGGVDAREGEIE